MNLKTTVITLGAITTLGAGASDAVVLKEVPLERVEMVANERVEAKQIGDVVETTMPWKGEAGVRLKYDLGTPDLKERLADKRKVEVFMETKDSENVEIGLILNERPGTNTFAWDIDTENYNWYKQPPLTEEEIDKGAFRPENVINSFAVYHKALKNRANLKIDTSRLSLEQQDEMVLSGEYYKKENPETGEMEMFKYGINYQTGKAFHRYRAQATDSNGNTTWAEDTNIVNGQIVDTFPDDWLDKAVYPVKI
jgi:hypothetical protein